MLATLPEVKKPFERFKDNEPNRRLLVSRLLNVIRGCGLRKFGAVLKKKDFLKAKAAMKLETDATVDTYVLCSRSAIDDLHAFAKSEGVTDNPRCVFEKGDSEHLLRKHLKKHGFSEPDFAWSKVVYKKDIPHDPFLGLQAAGWITWEYYVDSCRVFGLSEHPPTERGREAFRTFDDMPGHIKIPFLSTPLDDVSKRVAESFMKSRRVVDEATERLDTIRREREKERHD